MKCSKEELNAKLTSFIGENTSDEAISILEDVNDSMVEVDVSGYESRIAELEAKVTETENSWRAKYVSRFGEGSPVAPAVELETVNVETPVEEATTEIPSMDDIIKDLI